MKKGKAVTQFFAVLRSLRVRVSTSMNRVLFSRVFVAAIMEERELTGFVEVPKH